MFTSPYSSSSDDASDRPTAPATKSRSSKCAAIKAEPCEEKPPTSASLKFLLASVDSNEEEEDVGLSAEQLKKRRRNERDRIRSYAKRETMEQMRKTLVTLELQKQQLMQYIAAGSPSSSAGPECRSPSSSGPNLVVSTSSSLYLTPSTPVTRDDYVQLGAEIEEFRQQNAAMVEELTRRDLFNNSLRYRMASFSPLDSTSSSMELTQLTHDEGVACVWETLERIHDARLLYASEECFRDRPTFLGWSQYSERQGELVTFGVKKALRNVTPKELMDRTWKLQTSSESLRRLGPSHLRTHITLLQKITDDILIMDRRTEDRSRTTQDGRPLVLRTMYVLFRVADDDGAQTLGIKTLDIPAADLVLRGDEVWWDIFYWVRVSPAAPLIESDKQDVVTMTEFGGANSCAREDMASSRLKELIFLAIRWETLAVAPFLLQQ